MSTNLLLTLGHNSSAILIKDNKIVCGYEEERLTKVKSDSSFPKMAIMQCLNYQYTPTLDTIYISYWNDGFGIFDDLKKASNDKHYDLKFLGKLCQHYGAKIKYLSKDFTHHDAHAYAALNFFENHASTEELNNLDYHVIVSDGFGNVEETTSIYKRTETGLERIERIYDYFTSVGLMYQYATSYTGLKENEDEYKFLGYESHILELLTRDEVDRLYDYADAFTNMFYESNISKTIKSETTDYIDVPKLISVKKFWWNEFDKIFDVVEKNKDDLTVDQTRMIVAMFIQRVIEQYIGIFLKKHNVKNVILSGGIFYNVKLNNFIMNNIPGKICVYPLAGDQGAALGLQRYYEGKFELTNLFFGKRSLKMDEATREYIDHNDLQNFEYYEDRDVFIDRIVELLKEDKIVNIMTDDMEFGPRALGSTTTMALPTAKNVSYINVLNNRNDFMPMAPQILSKNAKKYFGDQVDKIIGSNFYMIITMDQLNKPDESFIGISHKYPLKDVWSSRCQIIDDNSEQYTRYVLEKVNSDFIINTSFNFHGTPVLYSFFDVIRNHENTSKNDTENRSYTIIGAFK